MRLARVVVTALLLFSVPLMGIPKTEAYESRVEVKEIETPGIPTYDEVIGFIERVENDDLEEMCDPADLHKINLFIAQLAQKGVLSQEDVDAYFLCEDIQSLLYDDSEFFIWSTGSQGLEYGVIPAIYYDSGARAYLCKSWLKKKCQQVKKFVKKHKKEIIVGAAIFVVVAVVVGVVAAVSSAGAAGAAASGGSDGKAKSAPAPQLPAVQAAVEEQIASFKESLSKESFLQPSEAGEIPLGESGRVLGSLFAHKSFDHLAIPQTLGEAQNSGLQNPFASIITGLPSDFGHRQIDATFSTNYGSSYADSGSNFNAMAYQMRGDSALASGCFSQAVHDFDRAIELNPSGSLLYLNRGFAHFGLGNYDRSIDDYQEFALYTQREQSSSAADFSLGFAKGLPRGIYDSGETFLLFLSDLVAHPVDTAGQMWDALKLLSDLARTAEWKELSKALVPEAHHLVTEWDTLSSDKKGERTGYILGKYGSDIIIPGALAKGVASGVKGAQELSAVYKSLQTAEKTLVLETASGMGNISKAEKAMQAGRTTVALGEELGFSGHQMAELKKAGKLEGVVSGSYETIAKNPAMLESVQRFESAKTFLKPYAGQYMPEAQIRELVHQAGIPTFPRPTGIPENFRVKLSEKPGGMKYVHPDHTHESIRVMPGKPHSPNPCQQNPYIIHMRDGKTLDKYGNIVADASSPEAHIPLEEFVYRGK